MEIETKKELTLTLDENDARMFARAIGYYLDTMEATMETMEYWDEILVYIQDLAR